MKKYSLNKWEVMTVIVQKYVMVVMCYKWIGIVLLIGSNSSHSFEDYYRKMDLFVDSIVVVVVVVVVLVIVQVGLWSNK